MNKKDVLEIRKQLNLQDSVITRICGCYVDAEKNIKLKTRDAFHSLPEEDAHKYVAIFRQTLSGTLGKNLMNMDFPLAQEAAGGTQEFLLRLRDSKLEDEMLLDEFYEKVITNYDYGQNYYIILIQLTYDIPGKASDGTEMFDASDEVYNAIMCSICPVNLTKPGLGYDTERNMIGERIRDWVVDVPAKGFLFPVFNDRSTDIHSVLYYSKKPEELQEVFIEEVLGSAVPLTAEAQKETFQSLVTETLGEDCDYDVIRNIHDTLNEMIENSKEEPEPLMLSKTDVKRVLEKSGVPDEKMEHFEEHFEEAAGEKATLLASNIAETRKFNVQTPDVIIKVNPDRTDLIETRIIDGRQCLVIAVEDHIEVNGVPVKAMGRPEPDEED